jgi:hypothetical protein
VSALRAWGIGHRLDDEPGHLGDSGSLEGPQDLASRAAKDQKASVLAQPLVRLAQEAKAQQVHILHPAEVQEQPALVLHHVLVQDYPALEPEGPLSL